MTRRWQNDSYDECSIMCANPNGNAARHCQGWADPILAKAAPAGNMQESAAVGTDNRQHFLPSPVAVAVDLQFPTWDCYAQAVTEKQPHPLQRLQAPRPRKRVVVVPLALVLVVAALVAAVS